MGETRVDLQHLLEDLRDAYSGSIEETILTEVVANALDSHATRIRLATSASGGSLTVADDGRGMQRRELARYHDVAASSKTRGDGIGFAGVGIKLGLLVSREVLTETRRGATHVATRWHLAARHRAPWKWIPPPGLTDSRGTAVRLTPVHQLSPLLDAGYLEETIRRQFEPLLDPAFDALLKRHYPLGIAFEIDGRRLNAVPRAQVDRVPLSIRLGRRRTPSAIGYLERHPTPLPEDQQGIAISTFGKVIKRGWDWLGISPSTPGRLTGLVEAPDLAGCLTLSKNDFIRTGARGATYLAYRKAIQEVVSRQLTAWGDARDAETRPRTMRLERDLERVLDDLVDDFPLLRSLVDRRPGGQKQLPLPGRGSRLVDGSLFADLPTGDDTDAGALEAVGSGERHAAPPDGPGSTPPEEPTDVEPTRPVDRDPGTPSSEASAGTDEPSATAVGTLSQVPGRRRPARYGLLVQYESRPDDLEPARLVDSTVWINEAHPACTRATASRSMGYHVALSVALALAPLAVEAASEHAFITQFLAHWGGAMVGRRPGKRQR